MGKSDPAAGPPAQPSWGFPWLPRCLGAPQDTRGSQETLMERSAPPPCPNLSPLPGMWCVWGFPCTSDGLWGHPHCAPCTFPLLWGHLCLQKSVSSCGTSATAQNTSTGQGRRQMKPLGCHVGTRRQHERHLDLKNGPASLSRLQGYRLLPHRSCSPLWPSLEMGL